jgi:pseudomonalisin/xanthomonalisin
VGGTTLLTNQDGSYNSEIAWYAGGGGLSQFEESPSWQSPALVLLTETGDRGVPDVSMDADPNSGATVYVNGAPVAVGGTSLSSPLSLGVWARAISANRKLGFASPRIYGLYDPTGGAGGLTGSYPLGGFHDITVGANGAYTALPGYDLATGLGTFWVDQFVAALKP